MYRGTNSWGDNLIGELWPGFEQNTCLCSLYIILPYRANLILHCHCLHTFPMNLSYARSNAFSRFGILSVEQITETKG